MLQLLIHNYVLHTHTDTHIRAYVHGYTTALCTRSTKADQLTVDLARRAHQSPGRLVDEDGLRGLPLAQRTGQGQSGVSFLVWELVRLQEPLHRRRREDGLRLARQVRHWTLRHSVYQEREQMSKGCMRSALRCALEAVRSSLQNIPNSRPPFCP